MKRLFLLTALMLVMSSLYAQVDRARAQFALSAGAVKVDPNVGGNARQFQVLDSMMSQFLTVDHADRYLVIRSYASPEGDEAVNKKLAVSRGQNFQNYIISKYGVYGMHTVFDPIVYEWANVLNAVREDLNVPSRDKVIATLEKVIAEKMANRKVLNSDVVARLRNIDKGDAYRYIQNNVFSLMRNVSVETRYTNLNKNNVRVAPVEMKKEEPKVFVPQTDIVKEPEVTDDVLLKKQEAEAKAKALAEQKAKEEAEAKAEEAAREAARIKAAEEARLKAEAEQKAKEEAEAKSKAEPETEAQDTVIVTRTVADTIVTKPVVQRDSVQPVSQLQRSNSGFPFYRFALKTNVLYDLALIPNIALEYAITDHWSVAADWNYAWWSQDFRNQYWRTYGGDVEVRYYLNNRDGRLLTGHHVGAYAGILTYDVEWGGKGYMGEKWSKMFGLSYGYSAPIGPRLHLDFELGIGYFGGEYYEYSPQEDKYYWEQTKNRRWFGPTRAEATLVWMLGK